MKLPVGFAAFSFSARRPLQSGVAKVREFSDDLLEGDISLYSKEGKTLRAWKVSGH